MAENTKIQWAHHTFNPWRGCTKVSAGCANCYAETMSKRNPGTLGVWGPQGTRVVASESMWREPLKWDKQAAKAGERHRVFCGSLMDVFEDWQGQMVDSSGQVLKLVDPEGWHPEDRESLESASSVRMQDVRARLFDLIDTTPHLDWLLLTKRPENIMRMMSRIGETIDHYKAESIAEVWASRVLVGTSVEDQKTADERIPHLLRVPAKVRFLSCEPLLGPVDLTRWFAGCHAGKDGDCIWSGCPQNRDDEPRKSGRHCPIDNWDEFDEGEPRKPGIHWVIAGGESGPDVRPCRVEWIRSIVRQCQAAGVSCFVKQLGASVTSTLPDGEKWPGGNGLPSGHLTFSGDGFGNYHVIGLTDRKGGDPSEWPEDLRVRELPKGGA